MVEHEMVASIQEVTGEKEMSITHIPANDWAAVGARLERCESISVLRYGGGFLCEVEIDGACGDSDGFHATPLEALTAALDAAEGKSQ